MQIQFRKVPRATYEGMTRGELIEALMATHVEPSPNNAKVVEAIEAERIALLERLQETEQRATQAEMAKSQYDDFFRNGPVAYCIVDRSAVVEHANLAAATLFCTSETALWGTQLTPLVSADHRGAFHDHISRCIDERRSVVTELTMNVRGRGEIVVEIVSTPRSADESWPDACRIVFRDVTRKRRQAAIPEFLTRLHGELDGCDERDDTVGAIVRACVPVLGDAVFVDLVDDGSVRRAGLSLADAYETLRDDFVRQGQDPTWCRYVTGVVETANVMFDPTGGGSFSPSIHANAVAVVPLVVDGRVTGVLGALRLGSGVYTLDALELTYAVARRAARALENARHRGHCACCAKRTARTLF